MKKIKLLFEKILNNLKDVFSKFPITMGIVLIVSVIAAICFDGVIIEEDTLSEIVLLGTFWAIGTWFSETYFKNKKIFKYISITISFIIAMFFKEYLVNEYTLFTWNRKKTEIILENILSTYIISLALLIIYKLSKDSKLDIKEYLLNVFSESFIVGITYAVLNLGISAVSAIFIYLILDGESFTFILRMLILSLGFYYIPAMISVFANTEKIKVSSFVEKLLLFVIFPLTMVAIFIIYLYLAKILILRDIPKNVIGRILICVYLVAIPVWAMVIATKKENFIKIAKIIPYIYLPLMILEIYSIMTRIIAYGFTPSRYLFILFIIFQLISFYIIIIKKEKYLRELILVIMAFVVIFFISPINYRVVSNLSQKSILDKYVANGVEFDKCSKEERKKYRGAYRYLINEYDGEKYINKQISEDDKIKLGTSFYEYEDNYSDINVTQHIYVNKRLDELDISNYSKIYYCESHFGYSDKVDIHKLELAYKENECIVVNLENYLQDLIKYNEKNVDCEEYFGENNFIQIYDSIGLYLTYISMTYDKDYQVKNLSIEGYLLEK